MAKIKVLKNKKITNADMSSRFPMNIDKNVWDKWQECRRKNDAKAICELLDYSRPVIDRALNYGHVKNSELTDKISAYFLQVKTQAQSASQELVKAN